LGSIDLVLASSMKSAPASTSALIALASSSLLTRMWRAWTSSSAGIAAICLSYSALIASGVIVSLIAVLVKARRRARSVR
jgi:hypothetical protein